MTGTLLATILAPLCTLLAYFALQRHQEAKPTRKRHEPTFVTSEELEEALDKHRKGLEWEWTEMYDKFEKLHLRLAKRDARAAEAKQRPKQLELVEDEPRASAAHYRRFGSV